MLLKYRITKNLYISRYNRQTKKNYIHTVRKKLLVIDISSNYQITEKNVDFIKLNKGDISLINSKRVYLANLFEVEKKKIKKSFLKFILFNFNQNRLTQNNFITHEIFNLRNDKTNFFDKIFSLIIIKKIKKRYKHIEVITDDVDSIDTYKSLKFKIKIVNKAKQSINFFSYVRSRFKFFLRAFLVIFFCKFFHKKNSTNVRNFALTIYPLSFIKDQHKIYGNLNCQYLNFSLTDESHLNLSIFNILKNIFYLRNNKKFFQVEAHIKFKDLIMNLINSFILYPLIIKTKKKYIFNGIDFSSKIYTYFYHSNLNNQKLNIYNNALKNIFKIKKTFIFHYYLFEYSFGFYISKLIRKIDKNIYLKGYQHGIFTKNLFWFNFLSNKNFKIYLPDEIQSTNIFSFKDYIYSLKKFSIKVIYIKKFYDNIFKNLNINKKSKNILVVLGQHDYLESISLLKEKIKINKINHIYYLMFHPGTKIVPYNLLNNKVRFFKSNLQSSMVNFNSVIFSQTTTLLYNYILNRKDKCFKVLNFDYKIPITFDKFINKTFIFK